ncbi:helix-turn-helix domain-containing protein [Pseudorhodobacter sp. E13]|uniref:helix-turn-helix domain-containing protein n=1 Tax=Pseudorhodobacter sp. E13 TaxID=2487931 RepID=UPI001F1FE79D|nr:helix-turn-helix domain-containing protein [Pseudorhodobacter sp. E13]
MAAHKEHFSNRLPTKAEIDNADQLRHIIALQVTEGEPVDLSFAGPGGETRNFTLIPALTDALLDIMRLISSGRGFRMVPVEAELTTQVAADMLNVSRPFLIRLLEKGDIPFTTVGRHRRIRATDLFAYETERDQARSTVLSELAALDCEGGLI